MSKDAISFLHYAGARNDPRVLKLISKHKHEGYSIFFMLLEMLRESDEHELELDYDMLSLGLFMEPERLKPIIATIIQIGLLEASDSIIYSTGLKKRISKFEKAREFYKERAKKAANARWEKVKQNQEDTNEDKDSNSSATSIASKQCSLNKNKNKKQKNKSKESVSPPGWRDGCDKHIDHIWLKPDEFQELLGLFGESAVKTKIISFDSQIENGVKKYINYKNHFKTIKGWLSSDSEKIKSKTVVHSGKETNFDRNLKVLGGS